MSPRALLLAALAVAATPVALAFRDGPPARVTGGFGEDSCVDCHEGAPVNAPPGALTVEGFPDRYEPGQRYEVLVVLARPQLAAAGFQLAIRTAEGTQAGRLELPAGSEGRLALAEDRGVTFAQHATPEVEHPDSGEALWPLVWIAPEAPVGEVKLTAAAVAADGDESQLGDHVFTFEGDAHFESSD